MNYNLLTSCIEEVALETLPKRPKRGVKPLNSLESVKEARLELQAANNEQKKEAPITDLRRKVEAARRKLADAYDSATADHIQRKIDSIAQLHTTCQHSAAWKVVHELTGRKQGTSITIKGGSDVKRKENWFVHFNNLLGQINLLNSPPTCQRSRSLESLISELFLSTWGNLGWSLIHSETRSPPVLKIFRPFSGKTNCSTHT